jgi:hypothetical protein
MGKGVALEFKKRFPEIFEGYERRCVGPTLFRYLQKLDVPVELYAPHGTPHTVEGPVRVQTLVLRSRKKPFEMDVVREVMEWKKRRRPSDEPEVASQIRKWLRLAGWM